MGRTAKHLETGRPVFEDSLARCSLTVILKVVSHHLKNKSVLGKTDLKESKNIKIHVIEDNSWLFEVSGDLEGFRENRDY